MGYYRIFFTMKVIKWFVLKPKMNNIFLYQAPPDRFHHFIPLPRALQVLFFRM